MAQARSSKTKKTTARKLAAVKSTRSTSTRSRKVETPEVVTPAETSSAKRAKARSQLQFRKSSLIVILAIIIVAALLYYFRSLFIVAMVNGQPVTRMTFEKQLESQSGKSVLNTMVTEKLIEEEAAKRHVSVSDSDVNNQVKTISDSLSKQGQKLSDALAAQGMTEAQLKDQIKYQQLIQKMVAPVTVTDKEITDYISKNKDSLGDNANSDATKSQVKTQLTQQKQNDEVQAFINNLQKNSKVDYFVNF